VVVEIWTSLGVASGSGYVFLGKLGIVATSERDEIPRHLLYDARVASTLDLAAQVVRMIVDKKECSFPYLRYQTRQTADGTCCIRWDVNADNLQTWLI